MPSRPPRRGTSGRLVTAAACHVCDAGDQRGDRFPGEQGRSSRGRPGSSAGRAVQSARGRHSGERKRTRVTSRLQRGPNSRIILGSATAIVVIALAITITIWRYETALSDWKRAEAARVEANKAAGLVSIFWHERTEMTEYLIAPNAVTSHDIAAQRGDFVSITSLLTPDTANGRRDLARAAAAHAASYRSFLRISKSTRRSPATEVAGLDHLVCRPLLEKKTISEVANEQARDARVAAASASSAAAQARA